LEEGRKKRKRKPRPNLKQVFRLLKLCAILMAVVLALYYFSQSPLFALQQIDVKGANTLTSDQVRTVSGLAVGQNIFRLDLQQASKRLLTYPLIAKVKIVRHYPDSVQITLVERQPRAVLLSGGKFLVIDRYGYCLERIDSFGKVSLPIITGIKAASDQPGKQACRSETAIRLLAALSSADLKFFSEFNLSHANSIVAYSRDSVPIMLGASDDLAKKMQLAISFVGSLSSVKEIDYVDLRAVKAPAVKYKDSAGGNKEKLFKTN
jgi:cell division protein FtsQ